MADFRKWRIHFNSLLAIRGFYFSWWFRRVAQIHFCSVLLILTKMVYSHSISLKYAWKISFLESLLFLTCNKNRINDEWISFLLIPSICSQTILILLIILCINRRRIFIIALFLSSLIICNYPISIIQSLQKISVISLFYPFQLWYSYSLFTNPSHNNKNRKTTSSLFIHIPTIIQLFSVDRFPFTSAFFSHDYLPLLTDLFILSSQPFSFSLWSSPFLSSPFSYLLISHINPN